MTDIWGELGIEPDSDERTIRRAYARRLKETNPEDDAEGFQALRQAYEAALAHATWAAYDAAEPEDVLVTAGGDAPPAAVIVPYDRPAPEPADPAEPDAVADARDLQRALVDTLQSGGQPEEAIVLLQRLLASPANDNLLFRDGLENWTAELIAAHLPHSDPLVDVAIAHYRWNADQYQALSQAVYGVLAWTRDREWIGTAAAPEGQTGHGWAALTGTARPAWQMRILALRPGTVGQAGTLLHIADTSLPILFSYFDAGRVEWWRQFLSRGRLSLATLGLVLAGIVILLMVDSVPDDRIDAGTLGQIALALMLGTVAAPFAYVRFVKPAPSFYADPWQPPEWRDAWLGAVLLLPLLSIVAPAGLGGTFALLTAGIALVTWVWAINPFFPPLERLGERIVGTALRYWLFGLYYFFHVGTMPDARLGQWTIVCLATLLAWHRGSGRAKQLLLQADPKWRAGALAGFIALLAAVGWLIARISPIGEGAYRASMFSLPCLGLMLLISSAEREQPGARFAVVGWLAVAALWFTAVTYAEPRPPRYGPAGPSDAPPIPLIEPEMAPREPAPIIDITGSEQRDEPPPPIVREPPPPPPWKAPSCPDVDPNAPLPASPEPCGRDRWFRSADYPLSALRREAGGTVQTESEVTTEGRLINCTVVKSSGHEDLDSTTCALLMERARLLPGRDSNGDSVPSKYRDRMTWVIEK